MARQKVIEITISDPETVLLLRGYRRFLAEEDGVRGSMQQIIEGMALAFMDDHDNFRTWCAKRALSAPRGAHA